MTSTDFSENALVEQPAIALFEELGWPSANCFYEKFGTTNSTLGRETTNDVILWPRLRAAIEKLNPDIANDAVQLAMDELAKDRSAMSLAHANREIYKLLKDGVKVSFQNDDGEEVDETVRVIDWNAPAQNDYFLASQFWVSGNIYKRRADLVGFVNGLPLLFIELKKIPWQAGTRLQAQPERLQGDHPATVLVQFAHHLVERERGQGRQRHGGLGAFFRLEADQPRRRARHHFAGNGDPWNVRAFPFSGPDRKLYRVR
jgi:type I site-specific restriction-modification system R (restriction) subunit